MWAAMRDGVPVRVLGCTVLPVRFRWRGDRRQVTAWRVWRGDTLIGSVVPNGAGHSPSLRPTLICSPSAAATYLIALSLPQEAPCLEPASPVTSSTTPAPSSPSAW